MGNGKRTGRTYRESGANAPLGDQVFGPDGKTVITVNEVVAGSSPAAWGTTYSSAGRAPVERHSVSSHTPDLYMLVMDEPQQGNKDGLF